jgi:hypothetical protein
MRKVYSTQGSGLHPATLPDEALLAVGRLVRAFAEMEDILNMFLWNVAGISELQAIVLTGGLPVSKKMDLAKAFAIQAGEEPTKVYQKVFGDEMFGLIQWHRNIVAHGYLLGKTDKGEFAFKTSTWLPEHKGKVGFQVVCLPLEAIEHYASAAENAIPLMVDFLKFQPLRETRRKQGLRPYNKPPQKERRKTKRSRQPPP